MKKLLTLSVLAVLALTPFAFAQRGLSPTTGITANGASSGATGSGTVNAGTQFQLGYYATTGTAISGDSNLTTDASNDLLVLQPNAATSGATQVASPTITLQSNAWTGSVSTSLLATLASQSAAAASGIGNFTIALPDSGATGIKNELLFKAKNGNVVSENVNDTAGGFFGETFGTAYFGIRNYSGSVFGIVPANGYLYEFGLTDNGAVGTVQTSTAGAPSFRNVLDDGTSGAKVGLGTATPLTKLTVKGQLTFEGTAPTLTCGTSPAVDGNASNMSGTVTVGTGIVSSCVVTFVPAFTTFNHCRVSAQTAGIASLAYSYSLTAITVTGTSLTSDVFDYSCDGQ